MLSWTENSLQTMHASVLESGVLYASGVHCVHSMLTAVAYFKSVMRPPAIFAPGLTFGEPKLTNGRLLPIASGSSSHRLVVSPYPSWLWSFSPQHFSLISSVADGIECVMSIIAQQ